jgi:hypothetical protein
MGDFPEPYAGSTGARVKDKVETMLKTLVCSGKVGLRTAQAAISSDWYSAYRLYALGESARSTQSPEPIPNPSNTPTVSSSPFLSASHVISPIPTPSAAPLPTQSAVPVVPVTPTPTPTPTSTPLNSTTPAPTATATSSTAAVTPGALCSPGGATGVSAKGFTCTYKTSATDSRLRWRE